MVCMEEEEEFILTYSCWCPRGEGLWGEEEEEKGEKRDRAPAH